MRIALISPTAYINSLGVQGDFQLGLAHLIESHSINEYEKALVSTNQQIILDNSLFELKTPEGFQGVIQKALRIKATHFFAPDYLYNSAKTIKFIDYVWDYMEENNLVGKVKVAAVVQAEDKDTYLETYKKFCEDDRISLIGLSILAIPYVYKLPITEARIECMKDLLKMNIDHKSCHLLGLGDSVKDVIFAKENCPWIVSHDSSSAIWNGFQGKRILENGDVEGGKTTVPVDFAFNRASDAQVFLAKQNIIQYKKLCAK